MSLTATVADYQSRRADVLLYAIDPARAGDQETPPDLAEASGELTTGIQKAAQRFVMRLLTPLGSAAYRPDHGCNFLPSSQAGGWRTTTDVSQAYLFAAAEVRRQLFLEQQADDPLDEQVADDELLGVTFELGSVSLYVRIITAAGATREYVVPVNVPIRG